MMKNKQQLLLFSSVLIALTNSLSTKMLSEVAGSKFDLSNVNSASNI